ncbi:tumor necrosis factor receptor superfamily member 5-like isoform X2 [Epinephelus fuscoguttatus]|uniref:tumor necrosis factor receptor superfamily member 5-like isoform X2 n=1 Tax=Epinephelus fuscoguttatus TaxID=293821 RepID=UPI0020D13341|nr:tumor necrosis factor receptor superfamily member 5-like isoform X2 [Epinephelus fuscoguttatus]
MIPLSSPLAALCLLIIWTIGRAAGCRDGQDEVDGRCCDLCPPGKYMTEFCSEHKQTVCRPCKEGYFADQSNMFDRCEKCRTCQQKYAEKCTPTANANCSCLPGFLCSNNVCSKCEENKCVSGEKPMRTASVQSDGLIEYSYQCEPLCTDNTRFNEKEGICDKTPVEAISTNATDFHLSKEESGVTFIMQDETKQSNSLSLMDLEKVSSCYCSGVPEQGT